MCRWLSQKICVLPCYYLINYTGFPFTDRVFVREIMVSPCVQWNNASPCFQRTSAANIRSVTNRALDLLADDNNTTTQQTTQLIDPLPKHQPLDPDEYVELHLSYVEYERLYNAGVITRQQIQVKNRLRYMCWYCTCDKWWDILMKHQWAPDGPDGGHGFEPQLVWTGVHSICLMSDLIKNYLNKMQKLDDLDSCRLPVSRNIWLV